MHVPLTTRDFLHRAVTVYGDRVAIVDEPDQPAAPLPELTWSQVGSRCAAHVAALSELGVGVGDRVAVLSQNSGRHLLEYLCVPGSGRVLVPINFRLAPAEVAYIVGHSGAKAVLVDPELEQVTADLDVPVLVYGRDDDRLYLDGATPEPWEGDETATATINYTSGTTARPKGVQLTHRSLWCNATAFGWHMGVSDRDVYLHTLPLFHVNGWGMPWTIAAMGGRNVLLRAVDGPTILRRVQEQGVTLLCGAPAVVARVLAAAQDLDGPVPGSGRVRIVVAGAPPPTSTIEQVETVLGWEFTQLYGLTETAPVLTFSRHRQEWDELAPAERARKLARAGAPAVGVRVRTAADGELLVRSNHVLAGYWDDPEATEAALEGGWFHTGDGGVVDAEHYVTISDRKKDVIISGGENVSSIEVEDVLHDHDAVAEVAVIGIPDEQWGETVTALVVLESSAQPSDELQRELIEHCRERIAHFKCPTSVEFREQLERTATGKLQKFKLRAPYWEGRDRQVS